MAAIDLKAATPDTTITGSDTVLFGADSQSATTPSVYPLNTVLGQVWSLDGNGDPQGLVGPDGEIFGLAEVTPYVNLSATGTAFTGPCELAGYDCTIAAGNITIYDNTSATGTVIVPTTALSVGRVEFGWKRALTNGCHVVLSGAATVNVLVG